MLRPRVTSSAYSSSSPTEIPRAIVLVLIPQAFQLLENVKIGSISFQGTAKGENYLLDLPVLRLFHQRLNGKLRWPNSFHRIDLAAKTWYKPRYWLVFSIAITSRMSSTTQTMLLCLLLFAQISHSSCIADVMAVPAELHLGL